MAATRIRKKYAASMRKKIKNNPKGKKKYKISDN
jgi:hypothetical protein